VCLVDQHLVLEIEHTTISLTDFERDAREMERIRTLELERQQYLIDSTGACNVEVIQETLTNIGGLYTTSPVGIDGTQTNRRQVEVNTAAALRTLQEHQLQARQRPTLDPSLQEPFVDFSLQ